MPNQEWDRVKESLKKPVSPEAMKEAAERFREYEEAKKVTGRPTSKPTLVSLGFRKPYPHAIPVEKIPDELERNPEFYKLMKKIVTKEKE